MKSSKISLLVYFLIFTVISIAMVWLSPMLSGSSTSPLLSEPEIMLGLITAIFLTICYWLYLRREQYLREICALEDQIGVTDNINELISIRRKLYDLLRDKRKTHGAASMISHISNVLNEKMERLNSSELTQKHYRDMEWAFETGIHEGRNREHYRNKEESPFIESTLNDYLKQRRNDD